MPNTEMHKENDASAVDVLLSFPTEGRSLAYVNNWIGVTGQSGNSGQTVAMSIHEVAYQLEVPSGLAVANGDILRVDLTAVTTTHTIPASAINKNAASGTNVTAFKAMSAKDANNIVVAKLIANAS